MEEGNPFLYRLGDEVKDIVTGFKGIIITRIQWFNGCIRYNVQNQKLDKDGKMPEPIAFDEHQLELVKQQKVKPPRQAEVITEIERPTGGPHKAERSPTKAVTRGK